MSQGCTQDFITVASARDPAYSNPAVAEKKHPLTNRRLFHTHRKKNALDSDKGGSH
jgi:hypothetical protein